MFRGIAPVGFGNVKSVTPEGVGRVYPIDWVTLVTVKCEREHVKRFPEHFWKQGTLRGIDIAGSE
ncbi:MAG: hypothetical protein JWM13_2310 [Arthrobacter sp.]|nr:hypothetical protein [Arthrobacter sp.]